MMKFSSEIKKKLTENCITFVYVKKYPKHFFFAKYDFEIDMVANHN